MLLAFDVGNTNIVLGVFRSGELRHSWRITSVKFRTDDEYAIVIRSLFQFGGIDLEDIGATIISCVVPPVLNPLSEFCRRYLHHNPCIVGPGVKTGMPILYENPRDVGADRIVNAVAAYEEYRRSVIVVDFGTATTFDFVSPRGEYLGGAIAPGLSISSEALFSKASKLPRVELAQPPQVIARNTVNSIQAGLFFGYAGLVDGIVNRMKKEAGEDSFVLATGGLCDAIAAASETIDRSDPYLALKGLRLIHERNKGAAAE
ncbi:MAG: type III pantothenate kinase [Deltaproteobacteria bacterium]|nr:type III pantothenate kinase [Deltaproteobacteria bacterium]